MLLMDVLEFFSFQRVRKKISPKIFDFEKFLKKILSGEFKKKFAKKILT